LTVRRYPGQALADHGFAEPQPHAILSGMTVKSTFLLSVLTLLIAIAPARGADCPVEGVEAIEAELKKAPSCDAAMTIFSACGFGSTIDVQFGGIVIETCEAAFLPGLSPSRRKVYERAQNACERKYARESGSMYRSAMTFCLAELAQKFAKSQKAAGPRK
jgi:hypothetical protein